MDGHDEVYLCVAFTLLVVVAVCLSQIRGRYRD